MLEEFDNAQTLERLNYQTKEHSNKLTNFQILN